MNFTPNLAFRAGDMTVATPVNNPSLSAPFEGVNVDCVLRQKFQQTIPGYLVTGKIPLDTPHPWAEFSAYLLCNQPETNDVTAGIYEFDITYAKLPDSRQEGRQIVWQIPGLGIGNGESNYAPVVSATNAQDGDAIITSIVLSEDLKVFPLPSGPLRNVIPGDKIFLIWNKITGGYTNQFFTAQVVGDVTDAQHFTIIPSSPLVAGLTPLYAVADPYPQGNTDTVFRGRRPRQQAVPAVVLYDYFLCAPGQTYESSDQIPIIQPPIIRDQFGNYTDTYSVLTTPTLSDYADQIDILSFPDGYVVATASTVRRWLGNYWERETIYTKAQ